MIDLGPVAAALSKAQGANDPHAESDAIWDVAKFFRNPHSRNRRTPSLVGAFMERVSFGLTDCWHWTGARTEIGYGTFVPARAYGCPEVAAHRIAWHLFRGPVPEGLKVLHRCDVRACVNPDHLFLGSQQDNVADMVAKGRQRNVPMRGAANPNAVMTPEIVAAMRKAHAAGVSQHELARQYGVAVMTVNRAVRGISWRDA